MRQLTVRGVDDSLHAALSDAAKQRGTSVNQFVLDLLNGHLGLASSRQADSPSFADLDHLAGTTMPGPPALSHLAWTSNAHPVPILLYARMS